MTDEARKKFLGTLRDALDDQWIAGYTQVKTFGVLGMTLRREGVDGYIQVVPSVVRNNVISWNPFPGTGKPHFDIKTDSGESLRTCVLATAVRMLNGWRAARAPVTRSPPQPLLATMRPRFEAIAKAEPIRIEDATDGEVTIDADRIACAFPREDDGRLELGARALLLEAAKQPARGRSVYVVATGPRIRKDGAVIRIEHADAIEANESHSWLWAPHLWKPRAKLPAIDPRAARYCELVDAGKLDDALALFELALGPYAVKVVEGVPLNVHDSGLAAPWRETLRRALWELAPWQRPNGVNGPIVLFPHQRHQRKAWLALRGNVLEIEYTGSNTRVAEHAWRRDVAFDLDRLGLAHPTAAAKRATRTAPKPAAPPANLVELIVGKELWKATRAEKAAKAMPHDDVIAQLMPFVRANHPRHERANALRIIGWVARPEDGPALVPLLDDPDELVRHWTIEAIKRAKYLEALPVLADIVNASRKRDRDTVVGVYAATAMKMMGAKKGPSAFIEYMQHADARVREAACHAFTIFDDGYRMAKPHLERCASDVNPQVAEAAKGALAKLGNLR